MLESMLDFGIETQGKYRLIIEKKDKEIARMEAEHEIQLNHRIAQSARLRRYNPSRRIVAMLFWEWRKAKENYNALYQYDKGIVEGMRYSFQKAYEMIKDNS